MSARMRDVVVYGLLALAVIHLFALLVIHFLTDWGIT